MNDKIFVTDDVLRYYTDPNACEACRMQGFLQKLSSRDIYSTFHYVETYFDLKTITSYNFVLLYNSSALIYFSLKLH